MPIRQKSLIPGCAPAYIIEFVCLSGYCVCVAFVVFTDCESCTRPISTNPASMEAGEYGLTRGTCFVACRLEVVTVAGLLWISWCVLGAAGFFWGGVRFFFFECKRPAAGMRPPCLIYPSTSTQYTLEHTTNENTKQHTHTHNPHLWYRVRTHSYRIVRQCIIEAVPNHFGRANTPGILAT